MCRGQHIKKAINICLVGADGVFDGAGNAAQGCLVKNKVDPFASFMTFLNVSDVVCIEGKVLPVGATLMFYGIKVFLVAGGKVVDAYHCLAQLQKGFKEVGANKSCNTGDEPCFWLF